MKLVDTVTQIDLIDARECRRLMATKSVGRVGFVIGGGPEILPVNFVLDGDAVVFATAPGSKLWGTTRSPVVFEVDEIDEGERTGWSVIVHGLAQEVTDFDRPDLVTRVRSLQLAPWAPGPKPHLVRIPFQSVTGRRVAAPKEVAESKDGASDA